MNRPANETTSSVSIHLPDTSVFSKADFQRKTFDIAAGQTGPTPALGWALPAPQNFSEVKCWGIAVEAPDFSKGSCKNASGAIVAKPGKIVGPFKGGSDITLEVPSGTQRTISVFAMAAQDGFSCTPSILNKNFMSSPLLVGKFTKDLTLESESVSINVSMADAVEYADCEWPIYEIATISAFPALYASMVSAPATEGGFVIIDVKLNSPATVPSSINWSTLSGTATAGADFVAASGVINFAVGDTSKQISVQLLDDGMIEGPESFTVEFSGATNVIASTNSISIAIVDDDGVAIGMNPPSAPTSLSMQNPAASISNNMNPTVRVYGVSSGDTVTLYRDNVCMNQVGMTVATGTYVDVTSMTLSMGNHKFAAKSANAYGSSPCSAVNLDYTLDAISPSLTISSPSPAITAAFSVPIQFVFTEPVSGFVLADINVMNGNVVSLTTSDNMIFNATLNINPNTMASVSVPATMAMDAAGNGNTASNMLNITNNTTSPTVMISSAYTSPTINTNIPLNINFSEIVTGFDVSDFVVTNGTVTGLTTSDGMFYTANLIANPNTAVTVSIAAGAAINVGSNPNVASNVFMIIQDSTSPTVVVSTGSPSPTNSMSVPVQFTFSEPVMNFTPGAIFVTNGNIVGLSTSDNMFFTATLNINANTTATVSVGASAVTDLVGHPNSASNSISITHDGMGPAIVSVSSPTANNAYYAGDVLSIQVYFSEPVYVGGGGSAQLNLNSGGMATYVSGSGTTTLNFVYTVNLGENAADLDYANNTALSLFGGMTMQDVLGNPASLILPSPGAVNSLGYNKALAINGFYNLSVTKVYPTYGNWSDYVKYTNSSFPDYRQPSEIPCDGSETGYYGETGGCIHGGEKLKVVVPAYGSCTNLTMTDSLGAFDWVCDNYTGTATFYSVGLKKGKGLKDLIATGGFWNTNIVNVKFSGTTIGMSMSIPWWSNPLMVLPINAGVLVDLNVPGAVYYANTSITTYGYKISAPRVSVVTLPGFQMMSTGSATNNFNTNDCYAGSLATSQMICSNQLNLWLEVVINGTNGAYPLLTGIRLANSKYSRIHGTGIVNLRSTSNSMAAIELDTGAISNMVSSSKADGVGKQGGMRIIGLNNIVSGFSVSRNTDTSSSSQSLFIIGTGATTNRLHEIRLAGMQAGATSCALRITGNSNVVTGISIYNIGTTNNSGVCIAGGNNNIIADATISATTDAAISLDGTTAIAANTFSHITATNNTWNGIYMIGSVTNTYFHSFVSVNADKAIESASGSGSGNIFHDTVVANNTGGINVNLIGGQTASFVGFIDVGQGAPACSGGGLSAGCNSPLVGNYSLAFPGKVLVNDVANTSDAAGTATNTVALDWLGFDSWYRTWGIEQASVFPSTSHKGACLSGSTCRIWDWRASVSGPLFNRSGDGIGMNPAFIPGATCPSIVDGNQFISANGRTFLKHAIEVSQDKVGNNNGLCESGEVCIYAPNIGAYQGEGNPSSAGPCNFVNGTISNVQMYGFPVIGI